MEANDSSNLPITAVCIVADKNKAPRGFVPIVKCYDDQSDADLWRDGFFTIMRQVRYICVSREVPEESNMKSPVQVVTNMIIVRETDPIPYGYVAIDYTADSKEKSLRKKFICVRTEPRDRVVDAIGEIVILAKNKNVPKNYTSAGEVDQLLICFKVIPIPKTYGISQSSSSGNLISMPEPTRLYPGLSPQPVSHPANLDGTGKTNISAFTMKASGLPRIKAIDGIDFKVNANFINDDENFNTLPDIADISHLNSEDYNYSFQVESSLNY